MLLSIVIAFILWKSKFGYALRAIRIDEDAASVMGIILSIAQRKKLELARALAMDPELLILNEVMAGLNPKELDDIMKEILLLKERGITIIAIEHVMKVIMGISDRVVVLHLGKLICEGNPNEVCNNPQVIEAYLGNKFAQRGVA